MTQTSERSKPIRQHPTIGDSDLNPDNNQSIMNTTNSQASTSTSTSTSPVVTLSQRPTHKLSRSNSLSLSKKQTYNPHNRRPISPTKQSKPSSSPLIIHRSQSTSARTRPISLNFKSSTDITHTTNQPIRSATTSTSPTPHSDVSSQALTPFNNLDLEHLKHSLQPGNEDLGLQLTPQKNRRSSRTALSNQPETSIEELESIQEASPSICRTIENLEQPVNSLDSSRCTTATITTTTKQASTEAENITVCVRYRP
ncbi:expressed protein [Phakopsora pachyrhizi]|uniref:Expressed protein n=1 Tax=Phakopsora pachyrhizi TaxID=170000 RepID=A0AAV0ANF6_PHAPC|nr:expressed protein [Phakopsora pachyrhizi]